MRRASQYLCLLALALFFLSSGGRGIGKPFTRGADVAGWTASMAGNIRADLSPLPPITGGTDVRGDGSSPAEFDHPEATPRWHQSPLPYYLTRGAFMWFGPSEFVTRLIALLFSLASGLLLYGLLLDIWNRETALLGLFAYWASPPVVVFAMSNNHIVLSLATTVLAIWLWIRSFDRRGKGWLVGALATSVLAMWTYWHAYFLPLVFAQAEFRHRSGPGRKLRCLIWGVLPAASFATFLLAYHFVNPDGPRELVETVLERSGASGAVWNPIGTLEFLAEYMRGLYGNPFIFLVVAYLGLLFARWTVLTPVQETTLLALGLCPLLYWMSMARIASLEPMLNILLAAQLLAVCFARGTLDILRSRQRALLAPLVFLLAVQVWDNSDKWQLGLYNIYNEEGHMVALRLHELTRPGDVIFEDGHEIGPGRLMYYAPQRAIIKLPNYPAPPAIHPADYIDSTLKHFSEKRRVLLVTTTPRTLEVVTIQAFNARNLCIIKIETYSAWSIYAVARKHTGPEGAGCPP